MAAPAQIPLPAVLPNAGADAAFQVAMGAAGLGFAASGWLARRKLRRSAGDGADEPVDQSQSSDASEPRAEA